MRSLLLVDDLPVIDVVGAQEGNRIAELLSVLKSIINLVLVVLFLLEDEGSRVGGATVDALESAVLSGGSR